MKRLSYLALIGLCLTVASAHADIYQWEYINPADPSQGKRQSTTLAPDGAGVDAVPGTDLSNRNLTLAFLIGADLRRASFYRATLSDAEFTGAEVREAAFDAGVCISSLGCVKSGTGITPAQLYSTASYQSHNLSGIGLFLNNLAGATFDGQDLTNANFVRANLTGANFRDANLANASFRLLTGYDCIESACYPHYESAALIGADFTSADARGADLGASNAITTNLILPDGHINGLDLPTVGRLVVRDYDGNPNKGFGPIPITVDQHLTMGPGGTLRMVFEADAWDSTISFAPGIPVALGGTLELIFADDVNLASQIGRTFELFDWTGVNPTGAFAIATPYRWNLSNLYTTGEITMTAIPEPATLALLMVVVLPVLGVRRARGALAILALVVAVTPAIADLPMTGTYVPEFQAVDALLQSFMVGKPIPGGTITITLNDKVIYERGIGYSNSPSTVPMQENALMRLASVSKPITASAIQQLAKDGQLNLNDKVFSINGNGGILDFAPYNGVLGDSRLQDITLQHLLEHRGGWNRDTAGDLAFRDIQIANLMGVPSPPGILNTAKYILSQPLQFTPGADYNYSNVGYMFLGMVVEAVSGQPYESYVDEKVLAPAGIPAWEIDAGRTFAADQNPREPVYSDRQFTQNVYNPAGPSVSWPYGGWDHERFIALGGLIASSKAIATLAQDRIIGGPEIGKLRTDYTTAPEYWWYHGGSLPGTDTLVMGGEGVWGADWKDASYSILFDRRPTTATSYSNDLALLLEPVLEGIATWPAPLVYAGDFTNDQWLTLDDITLFEQALALGSEEEFSVAYPTARYAAGDFDGDGLVQAIDAAGLIAALEHAGVPAEFVALVPDFYGDFNDDGFVDAADYTMWRDGFGTNYFEEDYAAWKRNFGFSVGAGSSATLPSRDQSLTVIPEPGTLFLLVSASAALIVAGTLRVPSANPLRTTHASVTAPPKGYPACLLHGFLLVAFAFSPAHADIYQWEYIDPADPGQGKRQSTTLAPNGAGVDTAPGANLIGLDLTMAYLTGADLSGANLGLSPLSPFPTPTILTDADLSQANLINAILSGSFLTSADLTDTDIRGANFSKVVIDYGQLGFIVGTGLSTAQLYSTASYRSGDLSGISFGYNSLYGGYFAGQNLRNADFIGATLTGANFREANLTNVNFFSALNDADFTDAVVRGATLSFLTLEQLYSTASYRTKDLSGIRLSEVYSAPNFAGQNLTNADFYTARLLFANMTAADIRGARVWRGSESIFWAPDTKNMIDSGGHINGLDLDAYDLLVVRDYDGNITEAGYQIQATIPITVDQHMSIAPGGTLRMVFEADAWDSTISFAPGIPVALGGTLELTFAEGVNPASQLGRTLKIFDWTGVTPTGAFTIATPYRWSTSNLYTTGEITLVPEPSTVALAAAVIGLCFARRRLARGRKKVNHSRPRESIPLSTTRPSPTLCKRREVRTASQLDDVRVAVKGGEEILQTARVAENAAFIRGGSEFRKTDDGGPLARLVAVKQFQFDPARNYGNFVSTDSLGRVHLILKQFRADVGRNRVGQNRVVGARIQQDAQVRLAMRSTDADFRLRPRHGSRWTDTRFVDGVLAIRPLHRCPPINRASACGALTRTGRSSPAACAALLVSAYERPLATIFVSAKFQAIHFPQYSIETVGD